MLPAYCTREEVQYALEVTDAANDDRQIDDAIFGAARDIDETYHRHFYPLTATRKFDYPPNRDSFSRASRFWLEDNELISVTSLKVAGTAVAAGDILLYPNTGPPFTRIEIDVSTAPELFQSGDTWQNAVEIEGVFGYGDDEKQAGELTANVSTVSQETIDVSNSVRIGVGDLIRIGDERMVVTGKNLLDTGQTWISGGTDKNNVTTVDVADGSQFAKYENIVIGGERMRINDIAGNSLIVSRGYDGSVLEAHAAGAAIFAPRTLVVHRAAVGTTASTHTSADTIQLHRPPPGIKTLAKAEAITNYVMERGTYARVIGMGKFARETVGEGINAIRETTYAAYGRKFRTRAV